jgi:hypothetical protein
MREGEEGVGGGRNKEIIHEMVQISLIEKLKNDTRICILMAQTSAYHRDSRLRQEI